MAVDKTNRKPRRKARKRPKGKNAQQDMRLKQLESLVLKTIERKNVDYQDTFSVSTTASTNANFLGGEQGVGNADRIGNQITLMNQTVRFNLVIPSGGDQFNQIRVVIAESTEGAQALTLGDILTYADYSIYGENVFSSPYTLKTSTNKRYKVHFDRVYELNSSSSRASTDMAKIYYGSKKSPGKVVNYDIALGTDFPTDHSLRIFAISDSGSVVHPQMKYNVRSTYRDA